MAGNITTFAIRYESKSGAHLYRPGGKVSYSRDEAAAALTVLGYSASDAYRAVRGIDCEGKTTEEILKEALRVIQR